MAWRLGGEGDLHYALAWQGLEDFVLKFCHKVGQSRLARMGVNRHPLVQKTGRRPPNPSQRMSQTAPLEEAAKVSPSSLSGAAKYAASERWATPASARLANQQAGCSVGVPVGVQQACRAGGLLGMDSMATAPMCEALTGCRLHLERVNGEAQRCLASVSSCGLLGSPSKSGRGGKSPGMAILRRDCSWRPCRLPFPPGSRW